MYYLQKYFLGIVETPTDGGWSRWSAWGHCSVSCGTGKVSRSRLCNNPTPLHGGRFCEGDPIEWKPCFINCPGTSSIFILLRNILVTMKIKLLKDIHNFHSCIKKTISYNNIVFMVSELIPKTPLHTLSLNKSCICGCEIKVHQGEIIATGRCPGLSLWLISATDHHQITLSFTYFNLFKQKQWVKIRNGGTSSADLIAKSGGEIDLQKVVSTTGTMLIEFMTLTESSANLSYVNSSSASSSVLSYPSELIHVHGFIASYSIQGNYI